MSSKGFINILFAVVIVIVAGVAGYFVLNKQSAQLVSTPSPVPASTNTTQEATSTPAPLSQTPTAAFNQVLQDALDHPPTSEYKGSLSIDFYKQPFARNLNLEQSFFVGLRFRDQKTTLKELIVYRVDRSDKVISALGVMNDDGKNGDYEARDGEFGLKFVLHEKNEGQIYFRPAIRISDSSSRQWISQSEIVDILPAITDTRPQEIVTLLRQKLLTAKSIEEVKDYFSEREITFMKEKAQKFYGGSEEAVLRTSVQAFDHASLDYQGEGRAQFSTYIERGNERFGATFQVEKNYDGKWRVEGL